MIEEFTKIKDINIIQLFTFQVEAEILNFYTVKESNALITVCRCKPWPLFSTDHYRMSGALDKRWQQQEIFHIINI